MEETAADQILDKIINEIMAEIPIEQVLDQVAHQLLDEIISLTDRIENAINPSQVRSLLDSIQREMLKNNLTTETNLQELINARELPQDLMDSMVELNREKPYVDLVLMHLIRLGDTERIQKLFDIYGAQDYVNNGTMELPLVEAVKLANTPERRQVVNTLLDNGADPNIAGPDKQAWWGPVQFLTDFELIPLIISVANGDLPVTTKLLEAGANPNVYTENILTDAPLLYSIVEDRQDIVSELLKHGANPNVISETGQIPLIAAIETGRPAIIEMMLDYGANPNLTNDSSAFPLIEAIKGQHPEIIKLLMNHPQTIVNVRDQQGNTPLTEAVSIFDPDLVRDILRKADETDYLIQQEVFEQAVEFARVSNENQIFKELTGENLPL